jgi:general secretion pathway protein J
MIYSPLAFPSAGPAPAGTDDLQVSYNFWGPAIDKDGRRPSRFIGSENKLSFISVSHIRIYADSPESDFAKVTYEIRRDDKNEDNPGTFTLFRIESANAFSKEESKDPFTSTNPLLHGIKKLEYAYYQQDSNTWKVFKSWDSDKEETKNLMPDIIELKMEVVGKKSQSFEAIYKFRPEIPFNGVDASF